MTKSPSWFDGVRDIFRSAKDVITTAERRGTEKNDSVTTAERKSTFYCGLMVVVVAGLLIHARATLLLFGLLVMLHAVLSDRPR